MKKHIKKLIKLWFRRLPNNLKIRVGRIVRKNNSLKQLLQSQSIKGKFSIAIGESSFTIDSKGGLIENSVFWHGLFNKWESDVGWLWMELSKCSDSVMDIGANMGMYSLAYKALNPKGKIYAFEPSIHHFPNLLINNKLNGFDIDSQQVAVSNFTGEQTFYDLPHEHSNTASLSPNKMKNWSGYKGQMNEYKVSTSTLADFIESRGIKSLDLLKIDVELHEPEVLAGLGRYLMDFKPIVVIEVLTEEIADKLNEMIPLSEYELFHLNKLETATRVSTFSMALNSNQKWEWNFVFFHKNLIEKVKANTTLYG